MDIQRIDITNKKVLIFSDTHLDTCFVPSTYEFLSQKISEADVVIINGDLWESEMCSFAEFEKSGWDRLLDELSMRESYYILGNHDIDTPAGAFKYFRAISHSLVLSSSVGDILVRHEIIYKKHYVQRFLYKYQPRLKAVLYEVFLKRVFGLWGFRIFYPAERFTRCSHRGAIKTYLDDFSLVIFSHTHYPTLDLPSSYINTGWVRFGMASWIEIDQDGGVVLGLHKY